VTSALSYADRAPAGPVRLDGGEALPEHACGVDERCYARLMRHPPPTALVASAAAMVIACATGKPVSPPAAGAVEESKSKSKAGWPESWGIEFGLRCAATGEDVRFCTCVAKEVQKTWTPEQFRSLGPEALQGEVRLCRERFSGAGAE
jgi:hypothetical protein